MDDGYIGMLQTKKLERTDMDIKADARGGSAKRQKIKYIVMEKHRDGRLEWEN